MGEHEPFEAECGDPFFAPIPTLAQERARLRAEIRFTRFKRYRDLKKQTELCLGDTLELQSLRKEFECAPMAPIERSPIKFREPEYTDLDGYDRERDERYMDAF
jgi:hypothetical protein